MCEVISTTGGAPTSPASRPRRPCAGWSLLRAVSKGSAMPERAEPYRTSCVQACGGVVCVCGRLDDGSCSTHKTRPGPQPQQVVIFTQGWPMAAPGGCRTGGASIAYRAPASRRPSCCARTRQGRVGAEKQCTPCCRRQQLSTEGTIADRSHDDAFYSSLHPKSRSTPHMHCTARSRAPRTTHG